MAVDKEAVIAVLLHAFKLVARRRRAALYDPIVLVHVKNRLASFWLIPAEQELRLKGVLQAVGQLVGRYKRSVLYRRLHRLAADPVKVHKKGLGKKGGGDSNKDAEKNVNFWAIIFVDFFHFF